MTSAALVVAASGFLFDAQGAVAEESGSCPYDIEYLPGDRLVSAAECSWQK